jgi:pyruvate/2-oxoglutarate dehydrogenase complex dihydrolipoamide dehydrogenase (E3) component
MTVTKADIAIIGGGSGGLSVAAGAAQLGARVVLFEGGRMGGDCLNSGCVPSKALLAAAKAAHLASGNPAMGITGSAPAIDFAAVKAYVAAVIARIAPHDSVERFERLGVTVIREKASFAGPHELVSAGHRVTARFIVIATGSVPLIPPIPRLETVPYHTNETIFTDTEKPAHLLVIGGGPIGVELAQAHRRLGCNITIIEAASLLPKDDPALVALLRQQLEDSGITIIEGNAVTGVTAADDGTGAITARLDDGTEMTGSHLLVAAGRAPFTEGLDLAAAGVRHGRGGIITDARLRTSARHIYAIGDVTGRPQFTHMAGYHAGIVIRNCLFRLPAKVNDDLVPWVTYCDPELAHVGLGAAAAAARHGAANIRVVETPLEANDRAVAEGRDAGMVKAVMHRNGRVLGASILAPAAGEMILPWCLALQQKARIGAIASLIAPYPTYGDASKRVAGSFFTPKLFSPGMRRLVKFLLRF